MNLFLGLLAKAATASADDLTIASAFLIICIVAISFGFQANRKISSPVATQPKSNRELSGPYCLSEVSMHNKPTDCWLIINGKVYDVTDFVEEHPGGIAILNNAGGDATAGFFGPQHPPSVQDVLNLYLIGELMKS